jgi:hypothetical protein
MLGLFIISRFRVVKKHWFDPNRLKDGYVKNKIVKAVVLDY